MRRFFEHLIIKIKEYLKDNYYLFWFGFAFINLIISFVNLT